MKIKSKRKPGDMVEDAVIKSVVMCMTEARNAFVQGDVEKAEELLNLAGKFADLYVRGGDLDAVVQQDGKYDLHPHSEMGNA